MFLNKLFVIRDMDTGLFIDPTLDEQSVETEESDEIYYGVFDEPIGIVKLLNMIGSYSRKLYLYKHDVDEALDDNTRNVGFYEDPHMHFVPRYKLRLYSTKHVPLETHRKTKGGSLREEKDKIKHKSHQVGIAEEIKYQEIGMVIMEDEKDCGWTEEDFVEEPEEFDKTFSRYLRFLYACFNGLTSFINEFKN
uniref:Uncharacterized protein n=1 Tax=Timema cristinae TaxID=61476 RepID=A0A7R9DMW5_TIMCR|nr:unnamed protein product [Timema cristinae]